MAGTFGYELDVTKLTDEEKDEIKEQIRVFHQFYDLIQYGDYYRLLSPNTGCSAWEFVSSDGKEALINMVHNRVQANASIPQVKIRGLVDNAFYQVHVKGGEMLPDFAKKVFPFLDGSLLVSGAALKNGGLPVLPVWHDYQCWQYHITLQV